MTQNTPRPAAREGDVPIAQSRIVIGRENSFVYIPFCPLCGLEHLHGQYPLRPLEQSRAGIRSVRRTSSVPLWRPWFRPDHASDGW